MALKYLLDTSALLAALWANQQSHARVSAWLKERDVVTCPLTELGFLRISVQPSGPFKATMALAKEMLADLVHHARSVSFLADDLPGSESPDQATAASVGDWHLAELAHRHGLHFASLNTRIKHPAVVVL